MIEYHIKTLEAQMDIARATLKQLRATKGDGAVISAIEADYHATHALLSALNPDGKYEEARRFTPAQVRGLSEVGFDFVLEISASSIGSLLQKAETATHFNPYMRLSDQIMSAIPLVRDVAVNSSQPDLPQTEGVSYIEQIKIAEEVTAEIKSPPLKTGTLEGVDFGLDRVSTLAQLDIVHMEARNGDPLFPDFFAVSRETYINDDAKYLVAAIGHAPRSRELSINGFDQELIGARFHRVVLVATPSGER